MPSGVSQVASSTPRPVVSLNAFAQSSARGAGGGPAQLDGAEVGDRAHACTPNCVVHGAEDGEGVAAGEHVAVDAVDRRGPACRPATPAWRRPPSAPSASAGGRRRRSPCRCRRCRRPSSPPRRSPSTPSPDGVSRPPAWNRLAAKRGAGGVPGDRADRGQVDRGAARPRRPRVAQRLELLRGAHPRQPAGRQRLGGGLARSGSFSARFGNSLTPVIASVAVASRSARASQAAAIRSRDQARVQRGGQAAGPLDLGEPVPRRPGEGVGERLDVPGAAGRVEHAGQVPLLDQQALGVAGDPPGERVGQARARRRTAAR